MKNLLLDARTACDINKRVDRIHRDLDYRGGKVTLAEVRTLLNLDLAFYSADDGSVLNQFVHKLKVGAKQVMRRPGLLLDAVRRFDLKALFVPDRKQILIDADLPNLKKRWSEGHEVLHSVIPWHGAYMLGDNHLTLAPSCHERIEAEANYGAGRLLFPVAEFKALYVAQTLNMERIKAIANHFGNTITSTLWRCVESDDRPCFGVIGEHPRRPRVGKTEVEHLIRSPSFAQRFQIFDENAAMALLRAYCGHQRAGPLGTAEILVRDDDGQEHVFLAETFCNHYHTLTLAQYTHPRTTQVSVPKSMLIKAPLGMTTR